MPSSAPSKRYNLNSFNPIICLICRYLEIRTIFTKPRTTSNPTYIHAASRNVTPPAGSCCFAPCQWKSAWLSNCMLDSRKTRLRNVIPVVLLTEESVLSSLQIKKFYALLILSNETGRIQACKQRLRKDIIGKIVEVQLVQTLGMGSGPQPASGKVFPATPYLQVPLKSPTQKAHRNHKFYK